MNTEGGIWLNWTRAFAEAAQLQPLWRRLILEVVLAQSVVFHAQKAWPTAPYDLLFVVRVFQNLLAREESALRAAFSVSDAEPQPWRSALLVAEAPIWLCYSGAVRLTTGTTGVNGALQFVVFEALRKTIDAGEGPETPFDLEYFAGTVSSLAGEARATVVAVLAGEDIRWWPDDP